MKNDQIKMKSALIGLFVLTAGVFLYLFNRGLLPMEYKSIVFSWPSLLIAVGIVNLFSRCSWVFGILCLLVGGFFILPKLDMESFSFISQNIWAILLIIAGLLVLCKSIWGRFWFRCKSHWKVCNDQDHRSTCHKEWKFEWKDKHKNKWHNHSSDSGFVDINYVFSGAKERLDIKDFKGGDINCVFGGVELDLTDCQLAEGTNQMEVNTVFGGIVLYAPAEWKIEIRQTHVFGNFVDNRPKLGFEVMENRKLILHVSSVFGGGEIKVKN